MHQTRHGIHTEPTDKFEAEWNWNHHGTGGWLDIKVIDQESRHFVEVTFFMEGSQASEFFTALAEAKMGFAVTKGG